MPDFSFSTAADLPYAQASRLIQEHIHQVDMPYRLTSIWQDGGCEVGQWSRNGELVAWGIFQPAWWNFDVVLDPAERGSALERELFEWGISQMQGYADRHQIGFSGSIELFDDSAGAERSIKNLASLGFKPFDWSILRFEKRLEYMIPTPTLPDGFQLRPLRGAAEVDLYVSTHRAAFGSDVMTSAWRARILQHPAYHPELDLVIEAPDGRIAGFCICWLSDRVGQIEPIGVHPEFRQLGLGSALEQAAFHRLQAHGAGKIVVDHMSFNEKAIGLSLKSGFQQTRNALRYYVEMDENRMKREGGLF